MLELVALSSIALITAVALRRVRDRVLAGLAIGGLVLIATPALLTSGGVVERLAAALYVYAPYWEYLIPLAFFTIALLPKRRRKKQTRKTVVIV